METKLDNGICDTFICPNLNSIDEKGKELNLKEETIKRAKNLAVGYFRKTYHSPHHSFAKSLSPAFIYIASVLENDKIYQKDIVKVFGTSNATLKKWHSNITDTLGIDMRRDRKISILDLDRYAFYLDGIDKIGKDLNLKDTTIEKAKSLAVRYFNMMSYYHYSPYYKQLLPAFVYTSSIIENDIRSQSEVYKVSGVAEVLIDRWHNDILRAFDTDTSIGLKTTEKSTEVEQC